MTIPTPLPTDLEYGYARGRYMLAVGDTAADPDSLPDGVPAVGSLTFTPLANAVSSVEPPTFVITKSVPTSLDAEGYVVDQTGRRGVWLVTGQYSVEAVFIGIPPIRFSIEVTAAHTEESPLELPLQPAIPLPPALKWVVNEQVYVDALAAAQRAEDAAASVGDITLGELVDVDAAGGVAGEVLTLGADGFARWQPPTGGGGGGTDGKSAYEIDVDNGYVGTVDEWLADLRGADGASAYDLAVAGGYVGTVDEWLASQKGADGAPGANIIVSDTAPADTTAIWLDTSGA